MIMIVIIVHRCHIFFYYGFPRLERLESVTSILPRHCTAVLTIFVGRGGRVGAARVFQGCAVDRFKKPFFEFPRMPGSFMLHFDI